MWAGGLTAPTSSWALLLLASSSVLATAAKFDTPLIITKSVLLNRTDENQRLCGKNGRLIKLSDNLPISCLSDKDCSGKGRCEPTTRFCCLPLIEYNPVEVDGCPRGYHSVRVFAKRPLVCRPNQPNQCPGDAQCLENKSAVGESRWLCCEQDAGELCGPTEKALKPCHPFSTQIECPPESQCLRSTSSKQFVCCVKEKNLIGPSKLSALKQIATRQVMYTCPRRFLGPEIDFNRERRCNSVGELGQCSVGFTCVQSNEDVQVFLCCGPAPINDSPLYRCASLGAIAETDARGLNVFCDLINQQTQCARGSTCQAAVNSYGMMICCRSTPTIAPICPEDRTPEITDAGYRPCDTGRSGQCQANYICLPSLNQPQIALCCSRLTNQPLICPDQQVLYRENGRPKICSLTQISPCPAGYLCRSSVSAPTIAICCSVPTTATCPGGYTPQPDINGNPLYCSEIDQNICPGGSLCLESQNQPGQRVCCRSTVSPRVCPEGLDALIRPGTNQLERCSNPGGACSQPAYTCRYSEILAGYVCCGRPTPIARCADGRETYVQDFAQTYTCVPTRLGSCPNGYDCAPSSLNGISVCCRTPDLLPTVPPPTIPPNEPTDFPTFRPPVQDLTCPTGWSAYEDGAGAHHFCRNALDSSCPQGFSCTQASINGIFLCCRLASNLRCQNTQATPLLQNNAPRLCAARYVNSCPQGFTCQQSTMAQVYICCSLTNSIVPVINGQTPYTINGNGPVINGQTPYTINGNGPVINGQTPWTINSNGPVINGQTPWTINNPTINGQSPWNLNGPTINGQRPPGWANSPGSSSDLLCSDGEIPAYRDGRLLQCNWLGQADICPPTYYCALSNRQGINVCCHYLLRSRYPLHQHNGGNKVSNQNVCGKTAMAYMDNRLEPLECSKDSNICPNDFDCQPSMADQLMYCCQEARCRNLPKQLVRVHKACQEDTDCREEESERCEHSVNIPFIRICCPTSTSSRPAIITVPPPSSVTAKTLPSLLSVEERARCVGRRTLLIKNEAVQCRDDDACPEDFTCSSLTTSGDPICCERVENVELVCPENRDPLRHVSSDQIAFCDPYDNDSACPSGFLCKWSTQNYKYVCCTPVAFCERGKVPLIDERTQQAKRCFERSSATGPSEQCGAGYSCSESTVPRVRVCCSVVGSAFVVASAANAVERSLGDDKLWTVIEG